jgi:hypothetical protein
MTNQYRDKNVDNTGANLTVSTLYSPALEAELPEEEGGQHQSKEGEDTRNGPHNDVEDGAVIATDLDGQVGRGDGGAGAGRHRHPRLGPIINRGRALGKTKNFFYYIITQFSLWSQKTNLTNLS